AARTPNPNTFALKTYRTPDAKKYFENERSAFEQLKYGEKPPENIIEYYGTFIRRGTYNIILEYADRGTLDDYMRNTAEPKTVIEIRSFWENILASLRGLVQIHGTHEPVSDGPDVLLGWHHDIDPSNILVVSRGQDSPYDCDFKIADLGLAHFKRYISSLNKATDNDRYGMSTYGAPETYRSRNSENCHLQVDRSADIWSMGCVLSEVATWVTRGSPKLVEYRRRRQIEIAKKIGVALSSEDRFHHGSKILETVDELHDDIKRNGRRCDFITPCVIERLVKGMVRPHPQSRGTAQFFLVISSEILKDAKRKREEAVPSGSPPNPDRTISDSGINVRRRRQPPSLPPEQRFTTEPQPIRTRFSSLDLEQGTISQSPFTTYGQGRNYDYQQISIPKPNKERSRLRSQRNYKEGIINDQEAPREASGISPTLHRVMSQLNPPHIHSQYGPRSLNPGPASVPFQPRESTVMPTEETSSQSREKASVLEHIHSDNPGRSQLEMSGMHPRTPTGHPESRLASVPKTNPTSQYPTMSVTEGLRIKKEKLWRLVDYPGEDRFHTSDDILKKRDHAFLIDNSESMQPHRKEVEEVVELLSALTQPYDPDGLDLYFSTEPTKLRPNTPEKLLKYLRERPARGRPDFGQRFAKIIEDYQSRFGKSNTWARLRHPNSTPSKGPRPLSLYVLTNGVWDPKCTLIKEVKNLVALLQEYRCPNKYVGIQFIRFGDDREAKKRLKTLDASLGLPLDVIDTTPADGNVWKMLLGAVNDWYDNDGESDEDGEDDVPTIQPSSTSSVSSGASDALTAGLDETTEFFLNNEELRDEGPITQHQLQSSVKREKTETPLRQLREAPSVEEEKESLSFDAAKSDLESSDALARLKEELGDFKSPFSGEAKGKKSLWIGGQQVHFELPETAPQMTVINELKLALEEHLKMPILWWPLKQPRKWLSSDRHTSIHPNKKKVVKCGCGKKKVLPELHERHEYTYRPYPELLDEDDRICLAEQALIHYYHGYETCFDTDHFSKLVDSIPCRFNGAELGYKGYGIWARQGWTLPKLAAFVLITQGDLQNAFVPALYWLAFITIFVMVPDVFRT
ncbi:MAG: hypothetical protein Q9192_004050, partial [Flavoplaca navasiana]